MVQALRDSREIAAIELACTVRPLDADWVVPPRKLSSRGTGLGRPPEAIQEYLIEDAFTSPGRRARLRTQPEVGLVGGLIVMDALAIQVILPAGGAKLEAIRELR